MEKHSLTVGDFGTYTVGAMTRSRLKGINELVKRAEGLADDDFDGQVETIAAQLGVMLEDADDIEKRVVDAFMSDELALNEIASWAVKLEKIVSALAAEGNG